MPPKDPLKYEEWKEGLRQHNMGERNAFYGRKHTEEAKKKMSQAAKNRVRSAHSEDTKRKIGEAQIGEKNHRFGKNNTEEHNKKISDSLKGKYTGEKHHGFGKHLSEETKMKMSKKLSGQNNPFYGRTHTEEAKKTISEKNKGRCPSSETRKKISASGIGRKHTEETKQKMRESKLGERNPNYGVTFSEERLNNMRKAQQGEKNGMYGRKHSKASKERMSESSKGGSSPTWKGGYSKRGIPIYETYAPRLMPIELVRRDLGDSNILNVKCAYCGKWIIPTLYAVSNRISCIIGSTTAENRFYCKGRNCRSQCPIFNQKKWPKKYKSASSREVQPELRQLVLKRDNYICQKCGKNIQDVPLHCHHYEGILINPLESADVDMCITLCKECHKFVHTLPDCGLNDMKCKDKFI